MLKVKSNEAWAADMVAHLPERWKKRLLSKHKRQCETFDNSTISGKNDASRAANIELREILEKLQVVRLQLDASDGDICSRADEFALSCMDLGRVQHQKEAIREAMAHFVRACHVEPPGEKIEHGPAIARMTCGQWWRRGLRKLHAKAVEGAAIQLGYVNKARDCYVSNESLARRGQQVRRNQAMLENTVMRNEHEQEFTLAELAAKGTASKAIRRGELMTRIAGFERIALERGDGGLFLTVTCPSRMHKWAMGKGGVFENPKYDGTNPKQAQAYLSRCYSRIRAKLAREKVGIYGFRIAEPHHDGCPHWHILIFHAQQWPGETKRAAMPRITAIFRRYLLADSPDETGARKHRVKAEVIDWSRGTAAGYIAKYVAKNIDGLHIEKDLFGNPALETSARVEAWASTWGIRQFQQVGGVPVGVWRELRRVKEVPADAPEHLRAAHLAVNKINDEEGADGKAADWAGYVVAQGGVFAGRNYRIRIVTEETGELGRYGELKKAQPVGVETVGGETYRDGIVPDRFRLVEWFVKSVRHCWEVVRRGVQRAGFSAPRTRVNNCTRENEKSGLEKGGSDAPGGGNKLFTAFGDGEGAGGAGFGAGNWFVAGAFG